MTMNAKKRLDPKNDVVFQKLFGTQKNKDILVSFLEAVLKDEKVDIETIEFEEKILNSEMILDEKIGILDIRAKTAKGIQINIEIQLINQYNMVQRTIFYWSKLFFSQISTGSLYKDLKRTITINLLNFNYLEFEKFHTKHHIYEDETKEMLSDILEINFIEIPKFIKVKKDLNNPLHRWLLFLANPEDSELEEIEMEDPKIKRAHEILDSLNSDEETIRLAELREKYILDERSRIEGAKEEGIKKGKIEGKLEGKLEGKAEMLLKQLNQKFNIIPDEYKKILMKLPEKKLEIIAIEIFNINNIKEIERYF